MRPKIIYEGAYFQSLKVARDLDLEEEGEETREPEPIRVSGEPGGGATSIEDIPWEKCPETPWTYGWPHLSDRDREVLQQWIERERDQVSQGLTVPAVLESRGRQQGQASASSSSAAQRRGSSSNRPVSPNTRSRESSIAPKKQKTTDEREPTTPREQDSSSSQVSAGAPAVKPPGVPASRGRSRPHQTEEEALEDFFRALPERQWSGNQGDSLTQGGGSTIPLPEVLQDVFHLQGVDRHRVLLGLLLLRRYKRSPSRQQLTP